MASKKPVPYSDTFDNMDSSIGGFLNYRVNDSVAKQAIVESMYMRVLTELSVNRFKWEGLPDTVNERFLETCLLRTGLSVFYKDDVFGFLALQGSGSGFKNMYNDPTSFTVIGSQLINKTMDAANCVPIWSNRMRIPETDVIIVYGTKLATIDRTIDINAMQMRRGYVVVAEESEKLSYQNIIRQHDEGNPSVFTSKAFDPNNIQFFPSAPSENAVINMQVAKSKIWNECMTMLGINNANQDKRERLVADEVNANDEQIYAHRNSALDARKEAAERINRKYGLSVSVDWNGAVDVQADYVGREVSESNE